MEGRRERKVVTVLFADLVGFTARAEQLDPEDVEAILRPYHERLRGELERFGGTVEKFIGDAVMALFGAPVAHEDDPERAVRAALAIRDWAREEDAVQVRIAVNTGEALINLDARPEAGEGMAAGDVVNTTARLQSAAPVNGVLVGETTYRATSQAIEFRELDPVEAKGKVEPLAVWEAVEPVRESAPRPSRPWHRSSVDPASSISYSIPSNEPGRRALPSSSRWSGCRASGRAASCSSFRRSSTHGRSRLLAAWPLAPLRRRSHLLGAVEIVKAQAGILESDSADEASDKLGEMLAEIVQPAEVAWLDTRLRPLVGLSVEADLGGDRRTESFAAWRRFFEALAARGRSSSSSKMSTGPTTTCSTSWTSWQIGSKACRCSCSARRDPSCWIVGRGGAEASAMR